MPNCLLSSCGMAFLQYGTVWSVSFIVSCGWATLPVSQVCHADHTLRQPQALIHWRSFIQPDTSCVMP